MNSSLQTTGYIQCGDMPPCCKSPCHPNIVFVYVFVKEALQMRFSETAIASFNTGLFVFWHGIICYTRRNGNYVPTFVFYVTSSFARPFVGLFVCLYWGSVGLPCREIFTEKLAHIINSDQSQPNKLPKRWSSRTSPVRHLQPIMFLFQHRSKCNALLVLTKQYF